MCTLLSKVQFHNGPTIITTGSYNNNSFIISVCQDRSDLSKGISVNSSPTGFTYFICYTNSLRKCMLFVQNYGKSQFVRKATVSYILCNRYYSFSKKRVLKSKGLFRNLSIHSKIKHNAKTCELRIIFL